MIGIVQENIFFSFYPPNPFAKKQREIPLFFCAHLNFTEMRQKIFWI